jgi:hypothetical protein
MKKKNFRSLFRFTATPIRDFSCEKYSFEVLGEVFIYKGIYGERSFLGIRVGINLPLRGLSNLTRVQARMLMEYFIMQRVVASFETAYGRRLFSLFATLKGVTVFSFLAFLRFLLKKEDVESIMAANNFSKSGTISFALKDVATYLNLSSLPFDYFNWQFPMLVNISLASIYSNVDSKFVAKLYGIY